MKHVVIIVASVIAAECGLIRKDGMEIIPKASSPIWFIARDAACKVKEDVLEVLNDNYFALNGQNSMYPFDLLELGLQVQSCIY